MQQKAKWGLLYTIVPLSLGLLWLDSRLTLQPLDHRFLEVGIVLVSFGLMAVWVRANQRAIAIESCEYIVYALPTDRNRDRDSNWARDRYNNPPSNIERQEGFGKIQLIGNASGRGVTASRYSKGTK